MNAGETGIGETGGVDRLAMRWRRKRPDLTSQPVSLRRLVPTDGMFGAAVGSAGIG